MVRSHRELVVWQKGMDLVVEVYRVSSRFPREEVYRLTSQITRAAVSVPANIAEGYGRGQRRDYARFLAIARGSLLETETLLMLAVRLGYLSAEEAQGVLSLVTEVSKMLTRLHRRLV
jgi:four helix bundle protein